MHPGTEVINADSAGNRCRKSSQPEQHQPERSNITYSWASCMDPLLRERSTSGPPLLGSGTESSDRPPAFSPSIFRF